MEDQQKRIQKALDKLLYLPHLREQQHQMGTSPSAISPLRPTTTAKESKGRVWDRSDFFCRLHTFRPATWFCKPAPLNPIQCARRGWTNTANDTLTCEFCLAKVIAPIPSHLSPSDALSSAQKHSKRLTEAHDTACPWSTACCQLSLLKFPQLPPETVKDDFTARAGRLSRLIALPPLHTSDYGIDGGDKGIVRALYHLLISVQYNNNNNNNNPSSNEDDSMSDYINLNLQGRNNSGSLSAALHGNTAQLSSRVKAIAVCGWDVRTLSTHHHAPAAGLKQQQQEEEEDVLPPHLAPESAMLCCDLCGSRVGLWTFFPKMQPLVMTGGTSTTAGGRRDGTARVNSSSNNKMSASGMLSPGTTHSQSKSSSGKNVLANTVTTIAGGALQESSEAATIMPAFGPFGSKSPSIPLFGAPEGALSSGGGGNYTNVAPTGGIDNYNSNNKRKSKRKGNEDEAEESEATLQQQQQSAAAAVLSVPKIGIGSTSSAKRPKLIPPSAASLQHYKTANVKSMHPIAAHKSFCPWAHRAPQEGGIGGGGGGGSDDEEQQEDNVPGWLYCLNTLVHLAMNKNKNKNNKNKDDDVDMMDGGTGHQRFDASALFRDVLRKVDG